MTGHLRLSSPERIAISSPVWLICEGLCSAKDGKIAVTVHDFFERRYHRLTFTCADCNTDRLYGHERP